MKTLELNTAERLVALGVFNNAENKVSTENLKVYLDDVHKFRLNDEDKTAVKWEEILADEDQTNDKGEVVIKKGQVISYKWDEAGVEPKKIEVDEFTRKFLQEKLGKLEVTVVDQLAPAIASLAEKIK